MNYFRFPLLLLVALVSAPITANAQSFFEFYQPVTPPRPVQVVAHRGMAVAAPESTEIAIKMCVDDYCEWAEVDVRMTKDGKHVIIHNPTVDATTNGTGNVVDMSCDQLKSLDAGSWFAPRFAGTKLLTLPELLALAKDKINLSLDCKQIDPKLLCEEISAAGMTRQVLVLAKPEVLKQVKAASNDNMPLMADFKPQDDIELLVKEIAPAAVLIAAEDISAEICQRLKKRGIRVQAATFGKDRDVPSVWGRIVEAGVDLIQTDDPAGLLFFIARRRIGKFPVMISLHRGANRYSPENTIPSIELTRRMGIEFAEIDIRTTRDDQLVLVHDGSVNRTTNGKGSVRDLTLEYILSLSAGAWFGKPYQELKVPTFDEGMVAIGDKMSGYLDAKEIAPEALVAMIHKHGMQQRHVIYQSVAKCEDIRKHDPAARIMPPLKNLAELDRVAAIKPYAVDADWKNLSAEMIDQCHQRNILVFSDCFGKKDTVEEYRKAIGWKIDCIQTDSPLRVLRAIELVSGMSNRSQ